jgi:hypothetical protein
MITYNVCPVIYFKIRLKNKESEWNWYWKCREVQQIVKLISLENTEMIPSDTDYYDDDIRQQHIWNPATNREGNSSHFSLVKDPSVRSECETISQAIRRLICNPVYQFGILRQIKRYVLRSKIMEMKKVTAHYVGIAQTSLNNRQCITNLITAQSCFDGNRIDLFRITFLGNHIHNLHQFYRLLHVTSFTQRLLKFVS